MKIDLSEIILDNINNDVYETGKLLGEELDKKILKLINNDELELSGKEKDKFFSGLLTGLRGF